MLRLAITSAVPTKLHAKGNGMMKRFNYAAAAAATMMVLSATNANAACTKPMGRFVGSGTGIFYNTTDGSVAELSAMSLSVNILSNGSGSAVQIGKTFTSGTYTLTFSVAAAGNVFNPTTCQGTIVNNRGERWTYTSSGSGNVVTFIYTKNDDVFAMYSFRLEKV